MLHTFSYLEYKYIIYKSYTLIQAIQETYLTHWTKILIKECPSQISDNCLHGLWKTREILIKNLCISACTFIFSAELFMHMTLSMVLRSLLQIYCDNRSIISTGSIPKRFLSHLAPTKSSRDVGTCYYATNISHQNKTIQTNGHFKNKQENKWDESLKLKGILHKWRHHCWVFHKQGMRCSSRKWKAIDKMAWIQRSLSGWPISEKYIHS